MKKAPNVNPWMNIPAGDYEKHMNSPEVDQLSFLSGLFRDSLNNFPSDSIALLGAATGNGLEHIRNENTYEVTAIDINPEYLRILKNRFEDRISCLKIIRADLEKIELDKCSYSLIFAGLILEYVNPEMLVPKISRWLKSGGVCAVVLQLPSESTHKITKTQYKSLELLDSIMQLVNPKELEIMAQTAGLRLIKDSQITLHTGKSFYAGYYQKP